MEDHFHLELSRERILEISSIGLAHMGDAVFELLVRAWLCTHGGATGRGMHQAAVRLVCAESQAEKAEKILPLLTEEERAVFRRGRNAQVHTVPQEALLGWLYLRGETERINGLFCKMMEVEDDGDRRGVHTGGGGGAEAPADRGADR